MKFESYLLTYISQNLKTALQLDTDLFSKNVTLINVANFCQIAADAVIQGIFFLFFKYTYIYILILIFFIYYLMHLFIYFDRTFC